MKIASNDIRKVAVEAYLSGKGTQQQLADIFGFHRTAIVRWVREFRKTGKLEPLPRGHMAKAFTVEECERLATIVKEKPDTTLQEIKDLLSKACSLMAVHRELKRLGFRYKKTLKASEQEREDIIEYRKTWLSFQKYVSPERLVFLDESSAKTNMTRLRGRSYAGSRCHGTAPNGHWKTLTMLSSIRLDGTTECVVVDGAMDRAMFLAYIAQVLCPVLRPGDSVIMDNLSAHKAPDLARLIKEKGAALLYLPAYSPDLNPIEKMWSKVKQLLRAMEARTYDALENAIAKALDMVTADDAKGWFKSCGYGLFQARTALATVRISYPCVTKILQKIEWRSHMLACAVFSHKPAPV